MSTRGFFRVWVRGGWTGPLHGWDYARNNKKKNERPNSMTQILVFSTFGFTRFHSKNRDSLLTERIYMRPPNLPTFVGIFAKLILKTLENYSVSFFIVCMAIFFFRCFWKQCINVGSFSVLLLLQNLSCAHTRRVSCLEEPQKFMVQKASHTRNLQ